MQSPTNCEAQPEVILQLDKQLLSGTLIESLSLLQPLLLHPDLQIQRPAAQVVVRLRYLAQALPDFSTSSELEQLCNSLGGVAQRVLRAQAGRQLLNR